MDVITTELKEIGEESKLILNVLVWVETMLQSWWYFVHNRQIYLTLQAFSGWEYFFFQINPNQIGASSSFPFLKFLWTLWRRTSPFLYHHSVQIRISGFYRSRGEILTNELLNSQRVHFLGGLNWFSEIFLKACPKLQEKGDFQLLELL